MEFLSQCESLWQAWNSHLHSELLGQIWNFPTLCPKPHFRYTVIRHHLITLQAWQYYQPILGNKSASVFITANIWQFTKKWRDGRWILCWVHVMSAGTLQPVWNSTNHNNQLTHTEWSRAAQRFTVFMVFKTFHRQHVMFISPITFSRIIYLCLIFFPCCRSHNTHTHAIFFNVH